MTEKKKMVARASTQMYNWLSKEFLTKKEVDDVKNLSEEFQLSGESLMEKTDMTSMDGENTQLRIWSVSSSRRQLVPEELEAAAHSIIEVGKTTGRSRQDCLGPCGDLVRDTVIQRRGDWSMTLWRPFHDVKDW